MEISQYYPYIFPNKDPHNPSIIPIYPLGSLGYPTIGRADTVSGVCQDMHIRLPHGIAESNIRSLTGNAMHLCVLGAILMVVLAEVKWTDQNAA